MMLKAGLMALGMLAAPALAAEQIQVELLKMPDCHCCEAYAEYLREAGFEVAVKATPDLAGLSKAAGVPADLEGCHLAFVDGYVISGHVPVGAVQRLLAERPEITGITLPGMPLGSPGMDGPKSEPFTIFAFGGASPEAFAVE